MANLWCLWTTGKYTKVFKIMIKLGEGNLEVILGA